MVKLNYHGHACFEIQGSNSKLIIDPWLKDNPQSSTDPADISVDAILVSHGHYDHLGDAIDIAKNNDSIIIGTAELVNYCSKQGAPTHRMHIGGSRDFGNYWVKLTPAWHGSSNFDENNYYMGMPCGFIIKMDGKTIYHAGDTGLFGDMKFIIGDLYDIDVAILPIGDNVVMGPEDAVIATKWLNPKMVIPMHYNTFPLIKQDPSIFQQKVEALGIECKIISPGESLVIK